MEQDRLNMEYKGSRILAEAQINGTVKSEQDISLDGVIVGDVFCQGAVFVNTHAVIEGNVECSQLSLQGQITGNVCVARQTIMGAEAVIRGTLTTASLEITPGAKIGGGLKLKNASK